MCGYSQSSNGKHLFILSGQSNMHFLDTEISFIPEIEKEFGKKNTIVVKDAHIGQPIRRWYKDRKPLNTNLPKAKPVLYNSLLRKIKKAIKKQKIQTITFIWMQGERDAKEELGNVYERSLLGLYQQLSNDLKRHDINFVIGRINDFDMNNERWPDWTMIRKIQRKVANSNPRFDWVNTDDLNDGINKKGKKVTNDLHMSVTGYEELGKRFALKAIQLIKEHQKINSY